MGKLLLIMLVFSAFVIAMPMARRDINDVIAMPTTRRHIDDVIAMPTALRDTDQSPTAVETWIENLDLMEQKVTKLHFYLHDIISGENPPSIPVAKANTTDNSPFSFGLVHVIDDPLTEGPDLNSTIIGRAQGLFAASSQEERSLLVSFNFYFTTGEYANSTLNIEGRNPLGNQYRELSIVGGSGVFRLARGLATAQTYNFNTTTRDAIIEYNVVVLHYEESY